MSEDPSRDATYERAMLIVSGCRTREQLDSAREYVRRFQEVFGDGPDCASLWTVVEDTDRRLFPADDQKG